MRPPDDLHAAIWPIIDRLPVSFYIKDRHSRFLYLNYSTAEALGLQDPIQGVGKTDRDFFQPEIADAWIKEEQMIMESGGCLTDKIEQERLIGTRKIAPWVLTCKMPLHEKDGTIRGLVGISKVISSTKEKMAQMSLAVDCANDGLWYRNYLSGEVWYSTRWKSMLGYEDTQLPNKRSTFQNLVFEEDWHLIRSACTRHMSGEFPVYECLFRMKHLNGKLRWILARGKARFGKNGKPEEFAGSHTDITEYKVSNELYEQILEDLPVLVFLKDADCRFRYINREMEVYFNKKRDAIIGRTDLDVNPDAIQAKTFMDADRSILNKDVKELFIREEILTHQTSGKPRSLQTRKRFLAFPSNDPKPHVLGVATNITETVEVKEALRRLKDSLVKRLETLTEMVLEIEKSENEDRACATAVSRLEAFGNIFGYPAIMISMLETVEGRPCIVAKAQYATGLWKQVAARTRRFCDLPRDELDILPLVLENGASEFIPDSKTHPACDRKLAADSNLVSQYVIPLRTPSLKIGTLQIAMGQVGERPDECKYYDAMAAHLSVAIERHRRITEFHEATTRLHKTAKLVAWSAAGTVVIHGLKHSLNNYLMVLKRAESIPSVRSNVAAMDFMKSTNRFVDHWADLFETHLKSARTADKEQSALLSSAVGDVVELVLPKARSRGCRVLWKESVASDIWVPFSTLYLHEMISVLVTNAIDANAKTVRIEASRIETTLPKMDRSRSYASLRVCDDGHGIASEYQDQVGKFGWTSKNSAGHGVGLTIVATLAEAFEGVLSLRSGGRSAGETETVFELLVPVI